MRFDRWSVGLGLSLFLFATPAFAIGEDECTTDADCGSGLGCVESVYTICEGSSASGGEGGRVEEETCYDYVAHVCAPKPCATDAECGGGTSCVEFTYVACSGGGDTGGREDPDTGPGGAGGEPGTGTGGAAGGAGGAGGAPLPPEECVEVTEAYCVPPWLAPCQLDADCGPGFRCVEEVICTEPMPPRDGAGGEGGAGAAGGYGGGACEPSDVKYCELIPTPCDTTADCGAGLLCEDFSQWICGGEEPRPDGEEPPPPPVGGEGGAGGSSGGDDGGTGEGGAGGGPVEPDCWEEPLSLCVPPGFVDWMRAYGPGRGGSDAEAGGQGGYGGGSAPAEDLDSAGAAVGDGSGGMGCQTGGGGLSLLALLGVALLLRRR